MSSLPQNSRFGCRRFEGRHAVITAGTAGIGLAIVERLAEEGAKISLCSRRQSNVESVVQSLHSRGFPAWGKACHVGDSNQVSSFIEGAVKIHGPIDVLVLNAAVNPYAGTLLTTPDSVIEKILDLNLKAAIRTVRLASTHLASPRLSRSQSSSDPLKPPSSLRQEAGESKGTTKDPLSASEDSSFLDSPKYGASVVFISSYTAYNPPHPIAMYGISKTALLGLTAALSSELGPLTINNNNNSKSGCSSTTNDLPLLRGNVRVNCVAPGIIPTRFSEELISNPKKVAELREATCLGRLGAPEEVAAAAAFLASDDASYITGETLVVAGGARCRL
uniref:Uncharacterized protein n=1 Tax=Polytomella parva TaxID=51329 RepID=A0A7S0UTQ1_9CHLO|mmetsp:Transcript_16439/g.29685  ORF Transcript_16439/g.29685 Transcript_16439/m.29685 type:complete len:334 (+) Transcript_16439:361-1362(+)|eukprot:CAMPEP_0175050888 /NCGR_PEP_ID=MMETSP0052_2-20121109/7495_1 /TAXON_ID=51329 ORGANISM="Polytomella parva, Strain SAG 63-3" /NCGR_SAMPLE_ID=MMETSP0052_2 /ASSEMBLY_ACC=CAM_ASM_000194 /LENGTH=333 /DNA_ID=CAMNT_0016315113 /DNA_START=246 /DNA_END=1247 /DNA_ORIENTATION=+